MQLLIKPSSSTRQHGFSLVELAIVVTAIGLITGSILAGKAILRNSKLRAIPNEYGQYRASVQTFFDKYGAYPGDIATATSYWGAQDGGDGIGTDCQTAASTTPLTCNGDGDAYVEYSATETEEFRFWQHLANAGLIEGIYNGINGAAAGSDYDHDIGINCPRSKMTNAGWAARTGTGTTTTAGSYFGTYYGYEFGFGGESTATPVAGVLKASEASEIDIKMDDGKPGRGKVLAQNITTCTNAVDNTDLDTTYQLNNNTPNNCALRFPNAFYF